MQGNYVKMYATYLFEIHITMLTSDLSMTTICKSRELCCMLAYISCMLVATYRAYND